MSEIRLTNFCDSKNIYTLKGRSYAFDELKTGRFHISDNVTKLFNILKLEGNDTKALLLMMGYPDDEQTVKLAKVISQNSMEQLKPMIEKVIDDNLTYYDTSIDLWCEAESEKAFFDKMLKDYTVTDSIDEFIDITVTKYAGESIPDGTVSSFVADLVIEYVAKENGVDETKVFAGYGTLDATKWLADNYTISPLNDIVFTKLDVAKNVGDRRLVTAQLEKGTYALWQWLIKNQKGNEKLIKQYTPFSIRGEVKIEDFPVMLEVDAVALDESKINDEVNYYTSNDKYAFKRIWNQFVFELENAENIENIPNYRNGRMNQSYIQIAGIGSKVQLSKGIGSSDYSTVTGWTNFDNTYTIAEPDGSNEYGGHVEFFDFEIIENSDESNNFVASGNMFDDPYLGMNENDFISKIVGLYNQKSVQSQLQAFGDTIESITEILADIMLTEYVAFNGTDEATLLAGSNISDWAKFTYGGTFDKMLGMFTTDAQADEDYATFEANAQQAYDEVDELADGGESELAELEAIEMMAKTGDLDFKEVLNFI